MFEPLNPDLHSRLVQRFGHVEITNAGMALVWGAAFQRPADGKPGRSLRQGGEEYRVNCPRCSDTRKRLYINHAWGVWDAETESDNLWLVNCYNEGCFDSFAARKQLYDSLYLLQPRVAAKQLRPGKVQPRTVHEQSPPGPTIRIDELAERDPRHPAVVFLQERGFDCDRLGRIYHVGYCSDSHYGLASNRIIIPVYDRGLYVGWQARYIGDPPKGVPRYWTSPGMPRRLLAYNFDVAVQHQTVVIVEGPTDVWQFGPQALALFGKTMHADLVTRLKCALNRLGNNQTIVVLLDPDQDAREKEKGRRHHIDVLAEQLGDRHLFAGRVVPVWLPSGTDPGGLDRQFMRDSIRQAAGQLGLPVDFSRPQPSAVVTA